MNHPPVRFVVFRYKHHSPHSGYSKLAEHAGPVLGSEVFRVDKPLSKKIIRERMLWKIARGTPGYDRAAMAAELNVAYHILKEPDHIYHFLYGETTYHYTGLVNRKRNNAIVATFHLPPSGIRKAFQIEGPLRQLSAVICLGHSQEEYFANIIDRDRIFYVPLGIDTEYFSPPQADERDPDLCLFVGDNYRDFPTLRGVIELVTYIRPKTKFVAVTSSQNSNLIGKHPNLIYRSGISEAELLELYHSASLLIQPLTDAVANNGLLEGMACGLPAVISDVGSVRDYTNIDCAALIPPFDARLMAEAVLDLLENPSDRKKMGELSRIKSMEFSWPKIIGNLQSVYEKIAR